MHLRQQVTGDDVDMAIRVALDSFISTQKFGVQKALQKVSKDWQNFFLDIVLELLVLWVDGKSRLATLNGSDFSYYSS